MYKFVVISGNSVVNTILADNKEDAEAFTGMPCVHSLEAGVGWSYDFDTEEFTAPEADLTEPVEKPAQTSTEPAPAEETPAE